VPLIVRARRAVRIEEERAIAIDRIVRLEYSNEEGEA